MLPRNLVLFRFPASLRPVLALIDERLGECALKPLGPLELSTRGFVSPYGRDESQLAVNIDGRVLIALGGEEKILPAATLNKALADRLQQVRDREGRNPGGRERKRLKDEVLTDLLPRALSKPLRTLAWLDLARGWLVVDSPSRRRAEEVVSALREALGSFPALPVNAEASPRALMTAWLWGDDASLPDRFALTDCCELRDPVDSGAVVRVRNQELDADEIGGHVKAGKMCFRLGLQFDGRLEFELGEDVVVRKLRFLESATEALESEERDDLRAEVNATFVLASAEVGRLLDALESALSLSGVDA